MKYNIAYYKFSDTALPEPHKELLENTKGFLNDLLSNKYHFGAIEVSKTGIYKYMGWKYDFRPMLKRYVFNCYGSWSDGYALNRKNLRKLNSGIKVILDYK